MTASVGSTIVGTSRSSTRTSRGAYRTALRMMDLLASRLGPATARGVYSVASFNRHLELVARSSDDVQAAVDGAEADQAGLGNGPPAPAIDNGDVVAWGPVADLTDFVGRLPLCPDDRDVSGHFTRLLLVQHL